VTFSDIPDRHANIHLASRAQFWTSPASRETVKSRIPSIYLSFSRFPHRILVKSRIPKIPIQILLLVLNRTPRVHILEHDAALTIVKQEAILVEVNLDERRLWRTSSEMEYLGRPTLPDFTVCRLSEENIASSVRDHDRGTRSSYFVNKKSISWNKWRDLLEGDYKGFWPDLDSFS